MSEWDDEAATEPANINDDRPSKRTSSNDPIFGLILAGAISIGLSPITNQDADLRYTLVWGMLALFGVLGWLFGTTDPIEQEDPLNLAWGGVFGLILSIPVLAFVGGNLTEISLLIFPGLGTGTVLAYALFIMPLAETLFFRGLLQIARPFWMIAIAASIWHLILFFPFIDRGPLPLIMAVVMLMANLLYGYIQERNGLAAAWICQITVNLILIFFPFVGL